MAELDFLLKFKRNRLSRLQALLAIGDREDSISRTDLSQSPKGPTPPKSLPKNLLLQTVMNGGTYLANLQEVKMKTILLCALALPLMAHEPEDKMHYIPELIPPLAMDGKNDEVLRFYFYDWFDSAYVIPAGEEIEDDKDGYFNSQLWFSYSEETNKLYIHEWRHDDEFVYESFNNADYLEIYLDGDHGAEELYHSDDRAGITAQTIRVYYPDSEGNVYPAWTSSRFNWQMGSEYFEMVQIVDENKVDTEIAITLWDTLRSSPENSKQSDLVYSNIIGVGWTWCDKDGSSQISCWSSGGENTRDHANWDFRLFGPSSLMESVVETDNWGRIKQTFSR